MKGTRPSDQQSEHTMAGNRKVLPLSEENYFEFIRTALQLYDDGEFDAQDLLLVLLPACCGLRAGEVTHLHQDWLQYNAQGMVIRVPKKWPCDLGRGGEACSSCQHEESYWDDPTLWGPKTTGRWAENGGQPVPVPNSLTNAVTGETIEVGLAQLLEDYLALNEKIGIASTHNVLLRVRQVASEADSLHLDHGRGMVERKDNQGRMQRVPDLHTHDLRGSWACHCLRREVSRYALRDWGGWSGMDMVNYYSGFVGDPSGEQRSKL